MSPQRASDHTDPGGPKEVPNGNNQQPLATTKSMKFQRFFNTFDCSGCLGTVFADGQCEEVVARTQKGYATVIQIAKRSQGGRKQLVYNVFRRAASGKA